MELPSEDSLRFIVSRYARLRAAHGEAIGEPELVLPTGEFFPDEFTASPQGIGALLRRTLTFAPVSEEIDIELAFVEAADTGGGGGCSSGACGTGGGAGGVPLGNAIENDDGYRVNVRVADVGDPALLTASLARSAGAIVLSEAGEKVDADERDALSEIAATAIGFGTLLVNGACVYMKSCGGLRAHYGTALGVEEASVALALFLRVHGKKPGLARGHMETTQREAFDEALRWVDSNEAIVVALRAHPETLADGIFPISEARGLLGRFFAKRAPAPPTASEMAPVSRRPAKSAEEQRRIDETKALVEEALRGS
jgi:hypothetical protein